MINRIVKGYIVGQKPEDKGTSRFIIEMPLGGKMLSAAFADENLAVFAAVPEGTGVRKAIHNLVVVKSGETIPLLVGEQLGDVVETLMLPTKAGPVFMHVIQVLPLPTSTLMGVK